MINIYWNSSNTLFQSDEAILVNYNLDRFSFSQMNLICSSMENYSIYLVPRQMYRQCHLQAGEDRLAEQGRTFILMIPCFSFKKIADCSNTSDSNTQVTISFRQVSPVPGKYK